MTTIVECHGVSKTYQQGKVDVQALSDIDLTIETGGFIALAGPSGSGKTTLLNLIGGLDTPDSGTIQVGGKIYANLSNSQMADLRLHHIGFIFQAFNLIPVLSALENVELPLLYAGKYKPSKLAVRALETVGLADRMYHEPNQLSGGQCQRVAIARAIVTDPAIILADEPTGNLDSTTGKEILELFKNLNEQGRTIVIVTHDDYVAGYCDRQIRMLDGKVVISNVTLDNN